jgi:hypothetical protein
MRLRGRNAYVEVERVNANRQPARFLRMLPVDNPDQALPLGGRIQIMGVELYDSQVGIAYRLAPLPNIEAVIREKLAAHDEETRDLPPEDRHRQGSICPTTSGPNITRQ